MVQSRVYRETTAGVKMFGSCWGDWVTGSLWSSKTSWPALEFNADKVSFGVLYYGNSTASIYNLKHQTKSTGVFFSSFFFAGELYWCETACENFCFITVSVLMLANNQDIKFQLKSDPPRSPVLRYRSKIQYATLGWFSSEIPQAGASEHGLITCQLAWVQ